MSYDLKDYVTVAERLSQFMKKYPEGSMQLDPVEFREIEGKTWVIGRAYAYRTPDDPRPGIGTAWEVKTGFLAAKAMMSLSEAPVVTSCMATMGSQQMGPLTAKIS